MKKLVGGSNSKTVNSYLFKPDFLDEEKAFDYCFNPTFSLKLNGGFYFLARSIHHNGKRINVRFDLNKTINEITNLEIANVGDGSKTDFVADARYFKFLNKSYVTYNSGHSECPNNIYIQMVGVDFNKTLDRYECVLEGDRRNVEKNWSFFEWKRELYCIYSISPFIVLKCETNHSLKKIFCSEIIRHSFLNPEYEKKYGELRGGCSPVFYKGLFYFIVQSNAYNFLGKIYTANILVFDPNRKFFPLRIFYEPAFLLTKEEFMTFSEKPLNKSIEACLYPTGAQLIQDKLYISYGVNDFSFGIRALDMKSITLELSI